MATNAGRGGATFASSNVMLVRNESSTDALVAMLASCSPVAQLQVQRAGGGLEDAVASCGQKRAYYPTFVASGDDAGDEDLGDDCTHNVEKKRRLSFDQVRSLERNFEVENKLEPERKMQLAKELGLQPRQVAVWFQNRRARWKTKQLERDYEVLTLDYNRLKSEFDAVMQEKEELQGEIECLTGKLQTPPQPDPVEITAPEKPTTGRRSKLAAPPPCLVISPTKASEGSVRSESPSSENILEAEGGSRATSSDSISSEILDADHCPGAMDKLTTAAAPAYSAEVPVDSSNLLHLSDHLCDQMLSPQGCNRISVKLEEGSFQDESSCNYILTQLDEERGLPWWDWP